MGENASMLDVLFQGQRTAMVIPSHLLMGLRHPAEVAQLHPHLREVYRTKVARTRSWDQFCTAVLMNYEAELKAFQDLVEAQAITQQASMLTGE